MTIPSETTIYRIHPAIRLHWASWDSEYVVFDETSGQTYQLDSVRAFILNTLCEGECTFAKIIAELSIIEDLAKNPDLTQLTNSILRELCANGLSEAINA